MLGKTVQLLKIHWQEQEDGCYLDLLNVLHAILSKIEEVISDGTEEFI